MHKIKRELVAEKVARGIIEYILENQLKPGDKLPTEREFTEQFVVGRPAVREALSALSMMKIIDIRHGDGIYFTEMNSGFLIETIKIYMELGMVTVDNFYEMRIILEAETAGLAAERITDDEIELIREYVKKSGGLIEDKTAFIDYDVKIHDVICTASRNPILACMTDSFKSFTKSSREITSNYRELRGLSHIGHEKILAALENHDRAAAMTSMREHLIQVKKFIDLHKSLYQENITKTIRQEVERDLQLMNKGDVINFGG